MNRLLLVMGTPGVGKSTLARSLSSSLGWGFIDLGKLVRVKKLYRRFDKKTRSYEIDEKRVREYLQRVLRINNAVVSTHSIGKSIPLRPVRFAIVLRLDPAVLYRRLRARRWTRKKAWENVESELVDVCMEEALRLLGKKRVIQFDTTGLRQSEILSKASAAVTVKSKRTPSRVDWLSAYDPVMLERTLVWRSSTS